MKKFETYLRKMNHSEQTIKTYVYQAEAFLVMNLKAKNYRYKDVLDALEIYTQHRDNGNYKTAILASIKKYYDYLIDAGIRNDHPCRTFHFKRLRKKGIIAQDLFTSEELELLLNREERYADLKLKNQALISLMIYQGLTSGEIASMKVQHINLDEGKIFVKESRTQSRRNLEIQPKQFKILDRYIHESRKKLLRTSTDALIIGKLGVPVTIGEVGYLVEQFKPLFPGRNLNPGTIRQSVIANWLNEKKLPLETVQLMAGHRWISSTLRYRQNSNEEKRLLINRLHPLG